ncbi:DNA-directed RNA polymerase, beta' subunit, partial [Chlamydia psittaci 09DC78]
RSK